MLRSCAVPVWSVMAPVEALMLGATPVIDWILPSSVPTVSVTLSWLAVAPEATSVSVVPLTVMVSPATKPFGNELLGAVPDNAVAAVIGAAGET